MQLCIYYINKSLTYLLSIYLPKHKTEEVLWILGIARAT